MNILLRGLWVVLAGALLFCLGCRSASSPAGPADVSEAAPHAAHRSTGDSNEVANLEDPVEKEFQKILADDDAAQDEIDKWIRDFNASPTRAAATARAALRAKIEQREQPIKKDYESFVLRHSGHVRARLAYGSYLNDTGDEEGAQTQWEKARELDPRNPAAWNNLGDIYSHGGGEDKVFECYEKAIEINPKEPVYLENLAVTVYLYRKTAQERYHLTEQQVFDKSLELYRKALALDPKNFTLACNYAESFYGTNPARWEDGLAAWTDVLKIAATPTEKEGVYVHLARINIHLGRLDDARQCLGQINDNMYASLKQTLTRNLNEAQGKAQGTNAAPAASESTGTNSLPAK